MTSDFLLPTPGILFSSSLSLQDFSPMYLIMNNLLAEWGQKWHSCSWVSSCISDLSPPSLILQSPRLCSGPLLFPFFTALWGNHIPSPGAPTPIDRRLPSGFFPQVPGWHPVPVPVMPPREHFKTQPSWFAWIGFSSGSAISSLSYPAVTWSYLWLLPSSDPCSSNTPQSQKALPCYLASESGCHCQHVS